MSAEVQAQPVPRDAGRPTLVERFIEFNTWPNARKTALLAGLVLVAHVVGSSLAHYAFAKSGNVDMRLLDVFLLLWGGNVLLHLVVSLALVRRGAEGRWTAYSWVTTYSVFIAVMLHLFGTMSTPHVLWYPAAISLWALYFDEVVGLYSALLLLGLILVVGGLELVGLLPYAPLLQERSLDAQHNLGWFSGHVLVFMVLLSLSFVLQWLAVAVRKVQESRLREAHAMLDRSTRLIRRYVPAQIADAILTDHHESDYPHERRRLTIFFSDVVGFSELAERLEPADLSRVVNEYFSAMTAVAERFGGTVDELSGDAILVLFGAPQATDDRDHALRAARMSVQMQEAVQGLDELWRRDGIAVDLKVRMGINTGVVTIGSFGSAQRTKYSAVGTPVNLAARLQAACEPGRVLISHDTWLLVHDEVGCTPHGELTLKGVSRPVTAYELDGCPSAVGGAAARPVAPEQRPAWLG